MADDLRNLLADAAPRPTAPLDARGLVGRARRRRRITQAVTGGAALVVLVAAVALVPGLGRERVTFEQPAGASAPAFEITAEAQPHAALTLVGVEATDPGSLWRGQVAQHELVVTNLDDAPARVDAWLHLDEDLVGADGQGSLRVVGACAPAWDGPEDCPGGDALAQPGEPLRLPLRVHTAHVVEGVYRLDMPLFMAEGAAPPPPIQLTYRVTRVATAPGSPESGPYDPDAPGGGPYDPDAVFDPARMRVEPRTAQPGDAVGLHFDQDNLRGLGFTLEQLGAEGWQLRFFLRSDGGGFGHYEPESWRPGDNQGWEDIGLGGPGPDRVVIPPVTQPGAYRICTANASPNLCAPVDVRPSPAGGDRSQLPPKCAPPAPSLTLQSLRDGEPLDGNDWELAASPDEPARLTLQVTVHDGVRVQALRFEVAPEAASSPGAAVWTDETAQLLGPGGHTVELEWDATDDTGRPVPPGRYHLGAYAEVVVEEASDHPCASRPGSTGREGFGLGYLAVP